MQDIRIERWAHTLVDYCLYVKAGETVAIRATPLASPLVEAVFHELLRVGAYPLPLIELESFEEMLLKEGNDNQLSKPHPVLRKMAEDIDEIGRASCRGKSVDLGGRRIIKKKKKK